MDTSPLDIPGTNSSDESDARSLKHYDIESARVCPPFCVQPASHTPEHFRDISFLGPITLHRLFFLGYIAGVVVGLYYLQNLIWNPSNMGEHDLLWTLLGIIWLVPLPSMVAWLLGAVWFKYNTKLDDVQPIKHNIAFRLVSRGTNAECLLSTIRRCQAELRKSPLFPYLIEVVTDGDAFNAPDDADVLHTVVPDEYQPPNGARFKGRALHYASQYSVVPGNTWIVHLDEESQLTSSGVKGIADMVSKCEQRGDTRRVGQGCILYHRAWEKYPFLTLADMRRTGDDIGHFHLQHRLGFTIFGLHGSYVVARQDLETEIGFDVGPQGSITEDAWWVLLAMERGVRTMWVDGYLEEQSTQSIVDFLKQRRRWYVGLWKVVTHCPVSIKYRAWLGINVYSWIITPVVLPLQIVYLVLSIIYSKQIILPIRLLTNFMLAVSSSSYLTGLVMNMREHGTPWYRGIMWVILQIVLFPVFQFMELCCIVMVFFSPLSQNAKGFHVVQKSGHGDVDHSSDSSSTTSISQKVRESSS